MQTELPNIDYPMFSDLSMPIYNHFMSVHGTYEGTSTLYYGEDYDLDITSSMLFSFHEYIPVVHEPSYIDMGNYIHYNPSPVFIPSPSSAIILSATAAFVLIKRKR